MLIKCGYYRNFMIQQRLRYLVALVVTIGLFSSCWDDFEEQNYYAANVTAFSFASHTAAPGIESYTFNIDQVGSRIYNLDSLPYGTDIDTLYPSITLQSSNGSLYLNDSLWEEKDSIDFSKPVYLRNTSADGKHTRTYVIDVRVHQVDPDSMQNQVWTESFPQIAPRNKTFPHGVNGFRSYWMDPVTGLKAVDLVDETTHTVRSVSGLPSLVKLESLVQHRDRWYVLSADGQAFVSSDGLIWTALFAGNTIPGTSLQLTALFGSLDRKSKVETEPDYLIGMATDLNGHFVPVKTADAARWLAGDSLTEDFPAMDYADVFGKTETNVPFFTIGGGRCPDGSQNTRIWSTQDGLNWVVINKSLGQKLQLPSLNGASFFYYDNQLVGLGGRLEDGTFNSILYVSKDHGRAWREAPEQWIITPLLSGLAEGQVYVERKESSEEGVYDEFIWYFGGQNEFGLHTTVWKFCLNKMLFARR